MPTRRSFLAASASMLALQGCSRSANDVVVYTALDQEFSEPLLSAYALKTGINVRPKFDVESTKTVGLFQLIKAEASRPRCDLFWNNEILNTLRLKRQGLLTPFAPAGTADWPAAFVGKEKDWYGFAARARILLVNTKLVPVGERPTSLRDLIAPKWKDQIGLAKPLFGTTATHAACLFATWGDAKAKEFFDALKANGAKIYAGNRPVAAAVATGEIAFALTDTDDAMLEVASGAPVSIIYPDRTPDGLGTLFIPNTLALIKNAPHREHAEALAAYILSPEVETALAKGPSAQIPLNPHVTEPARIETPKTVRPMAVDFEKVVDLWDDVASYLAKEFAG